MLKPFTESRQGPAEEVAVSVAASDRPLSLLVPMAGEPGLPAILLYQLAPPMQPCQLCLRQQHAGHMKPIWLVAVCIHVQCQQRMSEKGLRR